MARRRLNSRLVKQHYSYRIDEIASLFGVHKNTVANWLKLGLATIDGRRPRLINGHALRIFLDGRRASEFYCLRCRSPQAPAHGHVEVVPSSAIAGMLRALCATCGAVMHRRVSKARLASLAAFSPSQSDKLRHD